jgi:hypothetical protein
VLKGKRLKYLKKCYEIYKVTKLNARKIDAFSQKITEAKHVTKDVDGISAVAGPDLTSAVLISQYRK